MKYLFILLLSTLFLTTIHADNIIKLAKDFNLYAGTKATVQWERIFSSHRHMKRYKIDTLPQNIRDELKAYLIKHAADSDQPIVPGL